MNNIFEKKHVATEWDGAWFCDKCDSMHHWKEKAWVSLINHRKWCDKCKEEYENNLKNK